MQDGEFPKTNLAPAPVADTVHRNRFALGFSEREIRGLFQHTEFLQLPYKSHQLYFFENHTRKVPSHPVAPQQPATVFKLNERTVRKHVLHGPQQPGPLGPHAALDAEIELSLGRMLVDSFHEQKAMTQAEFLKIVREQHNSKLTKGWLHDFIGRHLDQLRMCRSLPQEDLRMAVPRACLEEHIRVLERILRGKIGRAHV
jgi:hypothetical protein